MAATLVGEQAGSWTQARVMQVTYCTARISARDNASGSRDQDVYLKALLSSGSVDLIESSYYTSKVKTRPLAVPDRKDRPKLVHPGWPVKVKTGAMLDDPDAIFMVSVADREEKGSDVNVATHLLTDVCEQKIDVSDIPVSVSRSEPRSEAGDGNRTRMVHVHGWRWIVACSC